MKELPLLRGVQTQAGCLAVKNIVTKWKIIGDDHSIPSTQRCSDCE